MSDDPEKSKEQRGAEAEVEHFQDDLGPFVIAAKTTRMAMVFTDATVEGNPIIFANDSFCELTGYERDELLGRDFDFLLAHAADAESVAAIEAGFSDSFDQTADITYRRKDGSQFYAALFVNPVRDRAGDIVQHFASLVDMTHHKDEQAHSQMLINELNHRVKNTLATVQSMVLQALRASDDPRTLREVIESRLQALSRSHDLLTRDNWKSTGLRDLVTTAVEPFSTMDEQRERFSISGENIRIPPQAALALGIAFNELATNALKYGALASETGSVLVDWSIKLVEGEMRLVVRWRERDGPPVVRPIRRGFGSRAIEQGLSHEMNGTVRLDFPPEGVVCTMSFPVPPETLDG